MLGPVTRRGALSLIPAAAASTLVRPVPPAVSIPSFGQEDNLGRLAAHFGGLYDRLVALYAGLDRMTGVSTAERHDFEDRVISPVQEACEAAELALRDAMDDRDTPVFSAAGKLFASTCFGPDIPDPPMAYVVQFDRAAATDPPPPPAPEDEPNPGWVVHARALVDSEGSDAYGKPLRLTFEFRGRGADAVRRWLDRNTCPVG